MDFAHFAARGGALRGTHLGLSSDMHASRAATFLFALAGMVFTAHCGLEPETDLSGYERIARRGQAPAPPADTGAPAWTLPPMPGGGAFDAAAYYWDTGAALPDAGPDVAMPPPASKPPASPQPPSTPTDPCAGVVCGPDEACVPYAHNQPLGVCVPTCDCSNCGNCGPDNTDGRWNDMQEYCGNPGAAPAVSTCNRPCGGGEGCIPFGSVNICWPMEGCFSQ